MSGFDIINFIGVGRENAVTRGELVAQLNLPDRTIRRLIQEARDRGEVIINAQDGTGYYKSDDIGELKRQYKTNRNRALSILRQQIYIEKRVLEIESREQIKLNEV